MFLGLQLADVMSAVRMSRHFYPIMQLTTLNVAHHFLPSRSHRRLLAPTHCSYRSSANNYVTSVKQTHSLAEKDNCKVNLAEELCNQLDTHFLTYKATPVLIDRDARCKIVMILMSLKVPAETIVEILSQNPTLFKFSTSIWEETLALLKSYSFSSQQFLPLLASVPSLLQGTSRETLKDTLALLRSLGIPEGKRQRIVIRNPELLYCHDMKQVLKRYQSMLNIFTKSEVQSLMLTNPAILTDPWEETEKKIKYVYEIMGIRSQEILKSQLFKHSLLHIVTRHKFATRTGFYRKPNKQEIKAREANLPGPSDPGNQSLRDIVDANDAAFAKSVGGLTLAEYQTFTEMISIECQNSSDVESDISESDEES